MPYNSRATLNAALAFAVLIGVTATSWVFVAALDRTRDIEIASETRLAANGWRLQEKEVADTASIPTTWDDAVVNLDRRFDRDWARESIVTFFADQQLELIFVVNAAGERLIEYRKDGSSARAWADLAEPVSRLTNVLRNAEARRPPFAANSGKLIATPIQATTVAVSQGERYLIVASLVQPSLGNAKPSDQAPIVIVGKPLDDRFVRAFSERYLLQELTILPPLASVGRDRTSFTIKDIDGQPFAKLAWTPDNPAEQLTKDLIAPLTLLAALLCGGPFLILQRERGRNALLRAERDRAEAASNAKSTFVANVSHEIRTPLNGVLGMVQLMERDKLSVSQKQRLGIIKRSGEELLGLLNDVLDLSKVEAGKLEIELAPFHISELECGVRDGFAARAAAKELIFSVQVAEGTEGAYVGDLLRLRQIVDNLVSNALKFTEAGSVTVLIAHDGESLSVAVRDSGIGISPDARAQLFNDFVQADASITRRFGGTGLGLAISRKLAGLMGGALYVESTQGEGSTFTLTVPLEPTMSALAQPPEQTDPTELSQTMRVLVAEDNAVNQLIMQSLLESLGCQLKIVPDGLSAVESAFEEGWDLILMDVQMPHLDGVEATRRIRVEERKRGLGRTPIIGLTANALTHQINSYLEAGMQQVVAKPIVFEDLIRAMSQTLDSSADDQSALRQV